MPTSINILPIVDKLTSFRNNVQDIETAVLSVNRTKQTKLTTNENSGIAIVPSNTETLPDLISVKIDNDSIQINPDGELFTNAAGIRN